MAECKYCYMEENGDIPDDRMYLFFERFEVPNEIEITMKTKDTNCPEPTKVSWNKEGDADACIVDNKLCASVTFPIFAEDGVLDDYDRKEIEIEINYCPMCGRKLERRRQHGRHDR